MAARLATPREMHRLAAERMVQLNPAFGLTGRTNVGRPESQTTGCSHLGPYYRFYAKATPTARCSRRCKEIPHREQFAEQRRVEPSGQPPAESPTVAVVLRFCGDAALLSVEPSSSAAERNRLRLRRCPADTAERGRPTDERASRFPAATTVTPTQAATGYVAPFRASERMASTLRAARSAWRRGAIGTCPRRHAAPAAGLAWLGARAPGPRVPGRSPLRPSQRSRPH